MEFNYYLSVYSNETQFLVERINLGHLFKSELKIFGIDMDFPSYFIGEALLTTSEQIRFVQSKDSDLVIDLSKNSYTLQALPMV